MNTKRSYLESLNAGRQRRVHASLEELNRSVETLGQRLDTAIDPVPARRPAPQPKPARASSFAQTDMSFAPRTPEPAPRAKPRGASDSSYQEIARDLERLRRQDEGLASASKIAAELKGLREEVRQQMSTGLRREFDNLRKDIQRVYTPAPGARGGGELGVEFDRLSGAIEALSDRGEDKGISVLRLELEQMKSALENLAREDTVKAVGSRWDDFDRRWTSFEDRIEKSRGSHSDDPAIDALSARLEQINTAVNGLPESLSLRSLEEKVRMLAGAVEHFARKQDDHGTGVFGLIEERLDEISRAIVASAATAQAPQFDTEPFERVEARITSLAHQIEELVDERPTAELFGHMENLARRVDEIAERGKLPEKILERFATQIAEIAERLENGQSAPDAELILRGIEQRFDTLSDVLDRRQGDALEQGQAIYRDLERRLDEVAGRLEARPETASADVSAIMETIDQRFAELARRVEERASKSGASDAIRQIETRLDDISARLESSNPMVSSMDPSIVRNLEDQVAELTRHLTRRGTSSSDMEDIAPRLDDIEKSITTSRESILSAARETAESVVRSLAVSPAEPAAAAALAEDLKSLEGLTRRFDERNTKTFEAIHDTLLKIVDRLTAMETSGKTSAPIRQSVEHVADPVMAKDVEQAGSVPSASFARRTPAQAAAAAAVAALDADEVDENASGGRVRSVLGGITRALSGKKERAEPVLAGAVLPEPRMEPSVAGFDEPLDPKIANQPLEPGSGAPDLNAIIRRVRDERAPAAGAMDADSSKSDFIAAARRAAQAAAAEAGIGKRGVETGVAGPRARFGDMIRKQRKPILMGAVALMVALAGLQLGKAFFRDDARVASVEPAEIAEPAEDTNMETAAVAIDPVDAEATSGSEDAVRVVGAPEPKASAAPVEITEAAPPSRVAAVDSVPAPSLPQTAARGPAPVDAGPVALREAADGGDAKAMFEIGSRYAEGRGTKSDMAAAAEWYEQSAALGFAPAQYRIGNFYEKGIGVARDVAKAKTWYQMAAEQGNASAMHNLAVLFAMGADGTPDNESAARWFVEAAELGVKDSQFNLGILSAKGVGVEQSLEESYKWFALVAKTGDRDASTKRDEVANALRPDQLTRARAAVELWKPKPVDPEVNAVEIPDEWKESAGTTAAVDMKKAVQNIQAILNKNGYDAGNPDGVMGQKTKTAIAAFQSDNGMDPTGEVDETLVRALLAKK